jgi:hypothetical protein
MVKLGVTGMELTKEEAKQLRELASSLKGQRSPLATLVRRLRKQLHHGVFLEVHSRDLYDALHMILSYGSDA